ncbi:MAG TPA: thiamine phosphate synthase [Casimicrobiaceae bacterium]|nr:thiamine phosphate synthase [Casimicrobiaceae bacterium]
MFSAATDERAARTERLRGLYAITPEIDDTLVLRRHADEAITGGAAVLQYRNKAANASLRTEQARALAELCRSRRVLFIVNDDAMLARTVGADGVHIGEDDGDVRSAREVVGETSLVGVSCYADLTRARAMVDAGADYVAFGSLYPSSVKPGARRATLATINAARSLGVRVVGIGGIDADNAADVIEAGADAVAVISAVFAAEDIEGAARAIAEACERANA